MLTLVLAAAVLGIGALAGLLVTERVLRDPRLAMGLVLAATIVGMALQEHAPSVLISSVRITFADVAFGVVAAAGVGRAARMQYRPRALQFLILLLALAGFSLLRGLPVYSESAVDEARRYLRFGGTALYFATVPYTVALRHSLGRQWLRAAAVVAGLVGLRWFALLSGVHLGPLAAEYDSAIRVLSGSDTFFLLEAFVIAVPAWMDRAALRSQRGMGVLTGVLVVLLNRRTVWLALVAALVVFLASHKRIRRHAGPVVVGMAIIGVAVFLALPDDTAYSDRVVAQSATSTGTLEWRVEGWTELIGSASLAVFPVVFGEPFGTGFEREVGGAIVSASPHSFYVETYLRTGIAGLFCLVALYTTLGRALRRAREDDDSELLSRAVLISVLAAHVLYSITWQPAPEQGVLIGIGLASLWATTSANRSGHRLARSSQAAETPRHAAG